MSPKQRRRPVNEAKPVRLFSMLDGFEPSFGPVKNILGMGDPDVHKIGDQWWMFFGGFRRNFKNNLFSASLPPGAPLSSNEWSVTTGADPRRATPLIEQPPWGGFDGWGLHTPSYVCGEDIDANGNSVRRERIYYAGRSSRTVTANKKPYSIGMLKKTPAGWARHPEPILTGTPDSPSVAESKARYFEGKWRIWYVSTPGEIGKRDLPEYRIEYVESEDGMTDWSAPKVLFSTVEGYFDAVVIPVADGYEMVVSRGGNLYAAPGFPPQGLWLLRSKTPSGIRADWSSKPTQILDADRGEAWYEGGIFGPSIHYGDTPDDSDTLYVFFSSVHRKINWARLAAKRMLTLKRPPVPAPFYFSLGRMQVRTQGLK